MLAVNAIKGPDLKRHHLTAQIGETLHLNAQQKGFMVAVPILSGAILRIALGLLVDRIGAKNTGIIAQLVVIAGLA